MKIKFFFSTILASVLLFLFVFSVLEISARSYYRLRDGEWPLSLNDVVQESRKDSDALFIEHSILPFVLRPNAVTHFINTTSHVNSAGFRGEELRSSTPLRILIVGGSTTFDAGVTSDDRTWCAQLKKELESVYPGVEVINGGLPVYSLWGNSIKYTLYDHQVRPDIVLIFQGINDLTPWWATSMSEILAADYWMYRGATAREWAGIVGTYNPIVESTSLNWLSRSVFLLGRQKAPSLNRNATRSMTLAHNSEEGMLNDRLQKNVKVLEHFLASLRSDGVLPIFVPQSIGSPTRKNGPGEFEVWSSALAKLNAAYTETSAKRGVSVLDLTSTINTWTDDHFYDALHYNDAGAREMGSLVANVMRSNKEVQNLYEFNRTTRRSLPVTIDVWRATARPTPHN